MHYTIYGGELSYFTRKLEAALEFYGAEFKLKPKDATNAATIEARAGTHQVPVLHTPENWMIADTTPLLHLLDERFPMRRLFPDGPLGVLTQIVEEYFDEWIARTMVHYRWHYPDSAQFASERMGRGDPNVAARLRDWGPRACRATGTDSPHQQRSAEAEYLRILEAVDRQLAATRYLLGDRPTAVDCIVLGGLRAHTNMDPDPQRVVAGYPRIVDWSERCDWGGDGELAPFPAATPFARLVLDEMRSTYLPYALGNRDAQRVGAKAFHVTIYAEDVSYLSRPYPELSRRMIVERVAQLPDRERRATSSWLTEVGLAACFDQPSI